MMGKYKVGSLFAGVGGICQGFKNANCDIVWANELDDNACKTYKINHKSTNLLQGDINNINLKECQPIDILTAGFPCQPFSSAGNKQGFSDKRGGMIFKIIEICKYHKPKYVILENVYNFLNHISY